MTEGKHALVTGGGRGIGRAIADALAEQGAKVSIVSRSAEAADAPFFKANADVTDQRQIDAAFNQARDANGPIEILVNNSGVAESAAVRRTGRAMWDRIIATNLTGPFLCTQAVVQDMMDRKWGRIINIASTAGLHGAPYLTAYTASKHGLIGMTRALAAELDSYGITVNAICPGYVDTDMLELAIKNTVASTGMTAHAARKTLAGMNPEGRIVTPKEVADTVVDYCASPMTGQAVILPGGVVA
ncbi:MAG: SDR family NAD(P)-dependent oxidoreductase [Candidatus Baltobacteraceae bacterium]